jgi:hypothetical protein
VSEDHEYAKNVILEFLYASGFHSSASVFYVESEMHQIPRNVLIDGLQVPDSPGLLAELLLTQPSHPSISTQTEDIDLSTKLEAVDREMKRRRQLSRYQSTEDVLQRGIEQIEREFEDRFQKEFNHRLDLFRAGDLSLAYAEETRRHTSELDRVQREMEAEYRQKTANLRLQFQRDSDVVRVKQRELEREISKWAEYTTQTIATEAQVAQAQRIKEEAARKEAKIKAKALILHDKLETSQRKLEDLKLEHNRAKREIEKLQMAITMYGKE